MMGRRYYEVTMPTIARELQRLNHNIERLCTCLEQRHTSKTNQEPTNGSQDPND
jgi:hypothetical protein